MINQLPRPMKKLIFISLLLAFSICLKAQRPFGNCLTLTSYLTLKGDTFVIDCDSVYLLNKKTFSVYQLAFEKWKGRDINIKQAFATYESLVELQSRRIEEQDLEYNRLKMQFDSLAESSIAFIDQTGNKLGELTSVLNQVNTNLNSAITNINDTEKVLKAEKKKRIQNSITWGVGGFTLGIVIALLLK